MLSGGSHTSCKWEGLITDLGVLVEGFLSFLFKTGTWELAVCLAVCLWVLPKLLGKNILDRHPNGLLIYLSWAETSYCLCITMATGEYLNLSTCAIVLVGFLLTSAKFRNESLRNW